jgi:PAS domain S-box-containing protein
MIRDRTLPIDHNITVGNTVSFAVIRTREIADVPGEQSWFYNTLLSLGEAIIATDEAGKVIFINPIAERLTGWTRDEAIGQEVASVYQAIDEHSGEAVQRLLVNIARGEDVIAVKVDMELVARDGSHLSIGDSAAPIKNAIGQTTGVVVVFHDTTQQRDVHRKVEAFNVRLRQAMAETNHRVKNNLQVIAALVDLQAEEGEGALSPSARQKLGLHIRTLAQIHDFLTEEAKTSEDLTSVSASETLAKLVPMVQATVARRLVSFTGDKVRLQTKQSSSLALIVNELISNALKHGKGSVDVLLIRENDTARVEVLDDGAGFPKGFDVRSAANNGLQLVAGLTKTDLAGELEFSSRPEGGGCVCVRFPIAC